MSGMGTILDTIAAHARERVARDKEEYSLEKLRELCAEGETANGKAFTDALKKPGMSFICEV